ncbi:MAG TPA: hypothetical protein VFU63_02520 [Ktedonobacterales bacterium]|nr:hypothetical protein [Ktedonobacterales bacterium]
MSDGYPEFRRRLDEVLRQRDPAALRAFLVAEGQWTDKTTTDPEAAMWMMIATSPALASLREDARHWLLTHGHEAEAQAIFGAKRSPGKPSAQKGQPRPKGAAGKAKPRAPSAGKARPRAPHRDDKRPRG